MTQDTPRCRLAARLDDVREPLVEITRALVAAASPNPPGDVRQAAEVSIAMLKKTDGIAITRYETAPGIVNVVARVVGNEPGRRIVFNGHLDTFPIGENLGWTFDPLGGEMREGRLYGRGVSDMKAGVAASILAVKLLAACRREWSGEVVLTLAGDEETMGELGTGWLLENVAEARGDAMISGDAGSPQIVRFGEKGMLWLEIQAEGSAAHGAHVHKGVNAIDRLRLALDALKRLEDMPVDMPITIARAIETARAISEPLSGAGEADTLKHITVNLGTVEGGTSLNLVPHLAQARADIRLPVGVSTDKVMAHIEEWLSGIGGVSWRVLQRCDPFFTDPDHEIVRCVADAAQELTGRAPAVNMRVGASDARLYRKFGIPSVVFGCTPFNMGAADEYVLVDELVLVARVHTLAAFDFLNGD